VQKATKVPECPNGLANLLQNLFLILGMGTKDNETGDDKGVIDVFDWGHIVAGTCRATFDLICENSFKRNGRPLVDDFRTFQSLDISFGTFSGTKLQL
jgi:hypothetical protein